MFLSWSLSVCAVWICACAGRASDRSASARTETQAARRPAVRGAPRALDDRAATSESRAIELAALDSGPAGVAGAGSDTGAHGISLRAVPANGSVGLDWTAVPGALGYRVYWSAGFGVDLETAPSVEVVRPGYVHRGLENDVTYHYAVAALHADGEGALVSQAQATPGGEWILHELGTGLFDDVASGSLVPRVPIERRVHVLLFAEGYTRADLEQLHGSHDGDASQGDVARFVEQVFAIEPYAVFREAFVIWLLPRASAEHIGGDTAFGVPVRLDRSYPVVDAVPMSGETAAAAWAAIDAHPFPPVDFYSNYNRRARNHIAYFLIFDPVRGRASVSGRASGLTDVRSERRISAAYGIPFAHEFTHAFGQLSDEYIDRQRRAGRSFGPTWNVVGTNRCAELPWRHLLAGSAINPGVAQLVGAFGLDAHGYHPELRCLMNGSHDNAEFFGGTGDLRSNDRLCNFCREMTAFRVLERTAVLRDTHTSFDRWAAALRAPFYQRFGFAVPERVPQTNDHGDALYEPCVD